VSSYIDWTLRMPKIKFKQKKHKIMTIILFYILILACLIIYVELSRSNNSVKINGIYLHTPINITEFHFTDNHGKAFSKKNLLGHWSILFFGFTNCPMICPTTMAELNKMYEVLQQKLPAEQLPQVIFISVDPKRDTVEKLNQFVHTFNAHFIGLRSNLADTLALEKQLHLTNSASNPNNHSMDILLLNPAGQVQVYFTYPHQFEKMAADYIYCARNVLKKYHC
jgi:protein SCO1/2